MQDDVSQAEEIRRLVRMFGEAGGHLASNRREIQQLRDFFGLRVLRSHVDDYILEKYRAHVEDEGQWPLDTTPDEYLDSLRQAVLDPGSAIYLTDADSPGAWSIYFVGRVRRAWRGPGGSDRVLVIFNTEHHFLITGFQPAGNDAYINGKGGFWLHQP